MQSGDGILRDRSVRRGRDRWRPAPALFAYGVATALPLAVTVGMRLLGPAVVPADASLVYLLATLAVASVHGLGPAVAASLWSTLLYNFDFLPPVGTLTIADPANWVALFAFLVTASVTSRLVTHARQRSAEAERRASESTRLHELGRLLLSVTRPEEVWTRVLPVVAAVLGTDQAHLAWIAQGSLRIEPDSPLEPVLREWVRSTLEGGAQTLRRHRLPRGEAVAVPLPGTRPPRLLIAVQGGSAPASTLAALGSLVALAIERLELIESAYASELLRESEALKATILQSVSHDIRTPLSAMQIVATALQDPTVWADEGDRNELLVTMEDALARLNRTVGNILCMTRIETGPLNLNRGAVPVEEVLRAAIDMVGPRRLGSRLRLDLAPDLPPLVGDAGLLATAVCNLLDNAVKYTPEGSPIEVAAQLAPPDHIRLTVADRGQGPGPGDLQALFEPFRRGARRGDDAGGIGLGLSIVRGLVAAHDGEVVLRQRPGGGTEAMLTLPVGAKAREREAAIAIGDQDPGSG